MNESKVSRIPMAPPTTAIRPVGPRRHGDKREQSPDPDEKPESKQDPSNDDGHTIDEYA